MSLLPIFHISAFMFYVWAIILVLNRRPITRVNIFGALLCSTFLMWSFSSTLTHLVIDVEQAYIWMNVSALGWASIPVASLWFYLAITDKKIIKSKYFLSISALSTLVFLYLQWSGQLIASIGLQSYGWVGIWAGSSSSVLFFVYKFIMVFLCVALSLDVWSKTKSLRQKRQAALLASTAFLAFLLGSITDIILPVLGIFVIPQIADVLMIIWGVGIILSVTKYGSLGLTPSTAAETILDTMTESLMIVDNKGKIVLINRAAKSLFTDSGELEGKQFTSIVTDKTKAEDFLNAASVNDSQADIELTYKTPDAREIPMLVSASVIGNIMEPKLGIVIVAKDISRRKIIENEIREQKELTDDILETTPSAVILIGYDLRIRLVNKAFTDLLKVTGSAINGVEIASVFPARELLRNIEDVARNRGNSTSCEFRHRINGSEKIFIGNILAMGAEKILVILNDVTIERQKQEKLYLTDRLATVGEMASGIAHELNNPLTSVLAISQLLKNQELSQELHDDIDLINTEAQRAAAIVKNMLTFARKHSPIKQPTQINKIIEEIIKLRSYEHILNSIIVQTDLAKDLPATTADYFQIQQVFLNIILNAESAIIEAKNQGHLSIKTEIQNGYIKAWITDNGIGISEENLVRVFDPFFTTKDIGKGTGLGLSISYGIITSHKGRISVASEQGKGTTFVVELPIINDSNSGNTKDIGEAVFSPFIGIGSIVDRMN